MANPYHHALSSVKKWGGTVDDYIAIHDWFDASKEMHGDFRHRVLRHHAQGIFEAERVFGHTIDLSTCKHCGHPIAGHELRAFEHIHNFEPKIIPTRWVGEQHVIEDCGFIPSLADWAKTIKPEPWMNKPKRLSRDLERQEK